jgi:hypothetical protein
LQEQPIARFDEHELVFLLGEELKKPLTVIQALSEADQTAIRHDISIEARRALRTIDTVLLYQRILKNQQALRFEPVHMGSTLQDVSAALRPLSLEFGCESEIHVQHATVPVDADRAVLHAAIASLWQAVLGLTKKSSPVYWHITRKGGRVRLVVTNSTIDTTKISLSQKRATGKSRQPLAGLAGPATDLLAAQGLFESMGGLLKTYRAGEQSGFSVSLQSNTQLAFL